jgi:hypothetical protein
MARSISGHIATFALALLAGCGESVDPGDGMPKAGMPG